MGERERADRETERTRRRERERGERKERRKIVCVEGWREGFMGCGVGGWGGGRGSVKSTELKQKASTAGPKSHREFVGLLSLLGFCPTSLLEQRQAFENV